MNITDKSKNIVDNCRFCWMCRHVCPIGNATGLERNTARARAFGVSLVAREATELSELRDNIYECSLCGACTNNCVTGFDPKVFVTEVKREIVLEGLAPDYITALLMKHAECGNIYGANLPEELAALAPKGTDTVLFAGLDAYAKTPECVLSAMKLISASGKNVGLVTGDSGFALHFLTGKTDESRKAAEACAKLLSGYKTVVVYDPCDFALMKHEWREWGIDTPECISFNEYVLSLVKSGALKVKKGSTEYMLQDSFAYARELDDDKTGRELIAAVGTSRDMLLIGKEANLAGHLIMAEYMPAVIEAVAKTRWRDALNMGGKNIVTECPAEYVALSASCPEGCRVLSVEEMLLENM